MSGFRNVLTAIAIAFVILLILVGGFATSFQEAGIFATPSAEISKDTGPDPLLPLLPVELNIDTTLESPVEFATMTATSISSNCPIPDDWEIYVVKLGDTVESLAVTFRVNTDELRSKNCLVVDDLLPGSRIYVPVLLIVVTSTYTSTPGITATSCEPPSGWIRYTVRPNDTLFSISNAYGISVAQLKGANCLGSNLIRAGSHLWVPNVATRTPIPSRTPRPSRTPTNVPPTTTQPSTPVPTVAPPTDTPLPPTIPPATPTPTETPISPTPPPTDPLTPPPTDPPTPTETETLLPPPTDTQTPPPPNTPTSTPTT